VRLRALAPCAPVIFTLERQEKKERQMATRHHASQKLLAETREQWPFLSLYERFEQVVAIVLSLVIAVVIVLALVQLLIRVVPLLVSGAIDPLDHEVFQVIFGMVMTILIAMEFKHSIIRVALRRSSVVQVKTVVLISLIALGRKFVILDTNDTSAGTIAALAGATLVLGVVYWLLRERDDRLEDGVGGQRGNE
jgi:uncharacterized membrane protein (DUF373 family)